MAIVIMGPDMPRAVLVQLDFYAIVAEFLDVPTRKSVWSQSTTTVMKTILGFWFWWLPVHDVSTQGHGDYVVYFIMLRLHSPGSSPRGPAYLSCW
jgi:hypothetical protein